MTILITGTKGFIGRNLKQALSSHNIIEVNENIFIHVDWRDYLKQILDHQRPEFIFHVGASSDTMNYDIEYMMTRNWESTTMLSKWAFEHNVPLVYSSTAAIYGDALGRLNLYAWSKYAGEKYVIANDQIALRYFNVYGPGEEDKGKMASIAYQSYIKSEQREEVKLFPGGPTRDFVYIEDVISANLYAMSNYNRLKGTWYDVGSGVSSHFESILDYLNIPYSYTDESDVPNNYQYYTCAKHENMMSGWEPKYDLQTGVKKYESYLCKII